MPRIPTMDLRQTLRRRAEERRQLAHEAWMCKVEQTTTLEELTSILRDWLKELETQLKH
jgi:hypothetical protein